VTIEADVGALRLRVEDDGCGLSSGGPNRGCGLLGIEERLDMVNGSLELRSGQSRGLYLQISLPLTEIEIELEEET
jgi:signal transduction histidine kinase